MITLDRRVLDARTRERWRVALATPPIASSGRPQPGARGTGPLGYGLLTLVVLSCAATASSPRLGAVLVVLAWLSTVPLALRAAARRTARDAEWPAGRFLFRWGYVEIDRDVMRLALASDLDVRLGRAFAGQPEVEIVGEGWRRAICIDPRDATRIGAQIARFGPEPLPMPESYRDATLVRGTPIAPERWPADVLLAVVVALAGACVVAAMAVGGVELQQHHARLAATRAALAIQVTEPFVAALAPLVSTPAPHVELSFDGCSPTDWVAVVQGSSVVSRAQRAAPEARRLIATPLRPPDEGQPSPAGDVIARCDFHGDAAHLVVLRTVIRLRVEGTTRLRHDATVTMEDALAAALACRDRPLSASPIEVASAMLAYARALIERDVLPPSSSERHRTDWTECIARQASTHPIALGWPTDDEP